VMHRGKIVEIGDAERVTREPSHPYTRALLQAVPEMRPGAAGS
jgi:oligopeptide/dipeptide ABC transporter ATP-binding protein